MAGSALNKGEPIVETVNGEGSVQAAEDRAMDFIFMDLKEHLIYLHDVYNLAFLVQKRLDGQRIADIADLSRAQFMLLMRVTDFVRCIQLLCTKGYPEQAGTLAASVFELAHNALFLERDPAKASEWLNARSIVGQMPKGVLGTNWREVVRLNTKESGDVTVAERGIPSLYSALLDETFASKDAGHAGGE